jgi:hypothetical protein
MAQQPLQNADVHAIADGFNGKGVPKTVNIYSCNASPFSSPFYKLKQTRFG